MAGCATRIEGPSMEHWIPVARYTGAGSIAVNRIDMTAFTRNSHVRAGQRELRKVVIKTGVFPIRWLMTGSAIRAVTSAMLIILLMAGIAILWGTLEHLVDMALLTFHIGMAGFQLEIGQVVIKGYIFPIGWRMTQTAIFTETAIMFIVRTMAGNTCLRRALIFARCMAVFAIYPGVLANQFEIRQVMVKLSRRPAIWRMTSTAILPKAKLVWVIQMMTGEAILQGILQISPRTRIQVAG